MEKTRKPHAVCIPLPAQGHINPMLKLAKLLHSKGFHITFIHTQHNYNLLFNSKSPNSLEGLSDFRFESISDGLPAENRRGIMDLPALCESMPVVGLCSFRELIMKLNGSLDVPSVNCIVSDGVMSSTLQVAEEFGIPEFMLFTPSACGILGYLYFQELKERGYFPLKDESCLTNGYLDTILDWIPSMEGIRLKDLPTFIRSTKPNDTMVNYNIESVNNSMKAKGVILNTFDALESNTLDVVKTKYPNLYTIGPLSMLHQEISCASNLDPVESSLWKKDVECIDWLDQREPGKVVYVNFGSLIIMTPEELCEFAWGLANSRYEFLWVIRPNLVEGGDEIMSYDFIEEIKDRGMILGWCDQEKVLNHPSIGGFLTHCGWNSTLESIGEGVPLLCWPFFAEQQTNCWFCCNKWGIGMEIDSNVKREKVEELVRELMDGNRGKEMRKNCMEWKLKAEKATKSGGSSCINFENLVMKLKE